MPVGLPDQAVFALEIWQCNHVHDSDGKPSSYSQLQCVTEVDASMRRHQVLYWNHSDYYSHVQSPVSVATATPSVPSLRRSRLSLQASASMPPPTAQPLDSAPNREASQSMILADDQVARDMEMLYTEVNTILQPDHETILPATLLAMDIYDSSCQPASDHSWQLR